MTEILALGVSHKTAPLELRERLALPEGRAVGLLGELTDSEHVHEAGAISTCNRTELYLVATDPVEAESHALSLLAREAGIQPTELAGRLYSQRGAEAARHLYRVTAGLDSMILGEAEVQGQVKRAYELALVEGAAGKRARSETGVSERGLSLPSVSVELARRTLGDLANRSVLLVGAGETAELTARALAARGVETVFVANRHHTRAIGLAQRFGGRAVRIDELPARMEDADIVVSSTNSPHHLIERDDLELVMEARDGRPLLLVDLAVPRDIEPGCREVEGVSLHDVDDVQAIADRNASGREAEARRAERLLDSEVERFERWLGSLEAIPTVAALRRRAEEVVERVLAENESRWESLSEADRERLAVMARAIANRLQHAPTLQLKRSAEDEDAYARVHALRELFGLDVDTAPISERDAEVHDIGDRRREREQG